MSIFLQIIWPSQKKAVLLYHENPPSLFTMLKSAGLFILLWHDKCNGLPPWLGEWAVVALGTIIQVECTWMFHFAASDSKRDATTPNDCFHKDVESRVSTHTKLLAEFIELRFHLRVYPYCYCWLRHNSNFFVEHWRHHDVYHESPSYLLESYKAGAVLVWYGEAEWVWWNSKSRNM